MKKASRNKPLKRLIFRSFFHPDCYCRLWIRTKSCCYARGLKDYSYHRRLGITPDPEGNIFFDKKSPSKLHLGVILRIRKKPQKQRIFEKRISFFHPDCYCRLWIRTKSCCYARGLKEHVLSPPIGNYTRPRRNLFTIALYYNTTFVKIQYQSENLVKIVNQ